MFTTFIKENWRPLAALTYLTICVFDFIIAPYLIQAQPTDLAEVFKYVLQLPESQQANALSILYTKGQWESLTLQGGGMFHIAFGAILGAAAWTRGMEKREQAIADKV